MIWGLETGFLAAWFQTHRRPRKRAADSAALGFFESVRAGRACTNVQRRDCWKQVNFAAVHVAHGLARSKVLRTMPPFVWGAAIEVPFLVYAPVGAALRRPLRLPCVRGFERPEKCPVDISQRERADRPPLVTEGD